MPTETNDSYRGLSFMRIRQPDDTRPDLGREDHLMTLLPDQLPTRFVATRESLRALACYVIAPYRKARTGRIGLRATSGGFGTPPLPDSTRVVVRGDRIVLDPGDSICITTLQAAADFLGVPLSSDPGVGTDLPSFEPGVDLNVDAAASAALGAWYAFAERSLARLAGTGLSVNEPQLWPEHFDLAVQVEVGADVRANVGFSPGDRDSDDPYLYIGPHDTTGLAGSFWNAPFGAMLTYSELVSARAAEQSVDRFIAAGIELLRREPAG